MVIELVLFVVFLLVAAGDCYSTAKLLRYNHKMNYDMKFRRKVLRKFRNELKKDESKAEMSAIGRRLIRKYGGDRTMAYIFVFGYGPLSLLLFYMLRVDYSYSLVGVIALIAFMLGILYRQILKAITLKKQFGIKI